MNVIFVSLPKIETTFPPGALAVLASVAKDAGYESRMFDLNLELFNQLDQDQWHAFESWCTFASDQLDTNIVNTVKKIFISGLAQRIDCNTKFVAFSVFSYFSSRIAKEVMSWYKDHFDISTIVGGTGVSTDTSASNKEILGDYLLQQKLADYVVFGEGEVSLSNILNGIVDGPGINYNNPQQIEDLTSLPVPTYEYFDMDQYENKKILVTGSRGCVRKCTFCDIELTWPKFRHRKAEHIIQEIKQNFYNFGITQFEFTDSLINGSITNFDRFNELLWEEKQKNPELEPIRYQGQFICRPSSQQKERSYELMHRAGCNQLIVGIESFSENVRNHMGKKFSNDDIDWHFKQCARWGIPNTLLMIVGYPTETPEDHRENLLALEKYKTFVKMGVIFMVRWGYTMHLYDHTPIMGMIDELGIDLNNDVKFDSLYSWTSSLNPSNTLKERIQRRLELHERSVELGYPMPRVKEELLSIEKLAASDLSLPKKARSVYKLKVAS
jgi:Radical SAM superfamily